MYNYEYQKQNLFTEKGQVLFLKVRDKINALLNISGAVMALNVKIDMGYDGWDFIACFDRMIELGEIKEITSDDTCGQYKVYIKKKQME